MINHINLLLVIIMLSSGWLCVTIVSVLLALKYRKYHSRPYLLSSCFFLFQALGIMVFLFNPVLNGHVEASFDAILKPSTIILGFITLIFILSYIVEIKTPGKLTLKSFLLSTAPFLAAAATLVLLRPSPIRSLADLSDNIMRPDVIARLVLVCLFILYPITVACLSYEWRQCMIPRKAVIMLHALSCILPSLFVIGLMCGYFPAIIANYIIAIFIDALVAYIELKIRIPVTEHPEKSTFEEHPFESFFDNPDIWMNPDMTVAELSRIIGTNRTYLGNRIKELGYQSFSDMINRKRVEYICNELKKGTDTNIISLMFQAGFRSRSTASREFKQIMGCSPSEYLESQQANSPENQF